jgi:PAT family beta-lactamase induction signal transducer AmpG
MVEPLLEFFKRSGAIYVLLFVLMFKMGDAVAGSMLTPFYLKMGYSKLEIAAIAKTLSLPFKIFGGFLGGALIIRMGLLPALWVFGILQALSTLSFATLTLVDHSQVLLGTVIIFEDVTASMGTAAFVAFMATMTNRKFTATQYALLSSLSGVPLRVFSGMAGVLAENAGWVLFFVICTCMAIPGMALIPILKRNTGRTIAPEGSS